MSWWVYFTFYLIPWIARSAFTLHVLSAIKVKHIKYKHLNFIQCFPLPSSHHQSLKVHIEVYIFFHHINCCFTLQLPVFVCSYINTNNTSFQNAFYVKHEIKFLGKLSEKQNVRREGDDRRNRIEGNKMIIIWRTERLRNCIHQQIHRQQQQ